MFNRIRIRFIMIASIAIFIILSSIVGIINTARCYQSQQEINRILHLISSNKGKLPGTTESSKRLGTKLSEDSLSQFRYYSVIFNANGHLLSSNILLDFLLSLGKKKAVTVTKIVFIRT